MEITHVSEHKDIKIMVKMRMLIKQGWKCLLWLLFLFQFNPEKYQAQEIYMLDIN